MGVLYRILCIHQKPGPYPYDKGRVIDLEFAQYVKEWAMAGVALIG
jgi:hypothetical protein